MLDWKLQKLVNQKFDLPALLGALGHRIDRIPITLLCPFHEDSSKSAKLFEDNRLYCWTCQKMYGPYDALQLLGISDSEILRKLSVKGAYTLEGGEKFSVDEEAAKALTVRFRLKKLSLNEYLNEVYTLLGN